MKNKKMTVIMVLMLVAIVTGAIVFGNFSNDTAIAEEGNAEVIAVNDKESTVVGTDDAVRDVIPKKVKEVVVKVEPNSEAVKEDIPDTEEEVVKEIANKEISVSYEEEEPVNNTTVTSSNNESGTASSSNGDGKSNTTTPSNTQPTTPSQPQPTTPSNPQPSTPSQPATPSQPKPTTPSQPKPSEHVHVWECIHHPAEYKTVSHPAEYKTVHHDAEYKTVYVTEEVFSRWIYTWYKVKCYCGKVFEYSNPNGIGDVFDLLSDSHLGYLPAELGLDLSDDDDFDEYLTHYFTYHGGYVLLDWTQEPIYETQTVEKQELVKEAWDEKVLVKEAWTEQVLVKEAWDEYKCKCGEKK